MRRSMRMSFRSACRPAPNRSRWRSCGSPGPSVRDPMASKAPLGVTVKAFAKINLTLRVLGLRRDGYHRLRTTLQSLALHDTLTFQEARGPLRIHCNDPSCPTDRTNLVWQAAEAMWHAAGRRGRPANLRVRIVKRIPVQA